MTSPTSFQLNDEIELCFIEGHPPLRGHVVGIHLGLVRVSYDLCLQVGLLGCPADTTRINYVDECFVHAPD